MHPNPTFRRTEAQRSLTFARERAFGTLLVNGDPLPETAYIPFLLAEDGASADLHLLRSNPVARAAPTLAKLSILGPDSYISPDWYGVPDQVPTWNYIAVHLIGRLELLPAETLHDMLERQTAHFEARLLPKAPWTTDKMSDGVMERMMRAITPARLHIEDLQSTWKLGQNKADDVRQRAADAVGTDGIGTGIARLAQHMGSPPE